MSSKTLILKGFNVFGRCLIFFAGRFAKTLLGAERENSSIGSLTVSDLDKYFSAYFIN